MRITDRVQSLVEGVLIAVDSLRANRVRAALTILGIAIGVFVVVVMSAAIQGINRSVAQEFEKAGPTTFFVNRFPISLEGCSDADDDTCKWRSNPPLRLTEAAAIKRLSTIEDVTINTGTSASAKYRDRLLSSMRISAYTANWIEVSGGDIVQGRNFTLGEETNGARVVVINEQVAERLFNGVDPIGKVLLLSKSPFLVIGVYKGGGDFLSEPSPRAFVPFTAGRRYLNLWIDWIDFIVKPVPSATRDEAIDDVVATIRGMRGLRPGTTENFAVITQDKLFETWGKMTGIFFLVMITLSGIGLIVGGVGVVAIMMISVTERTREIGVRKALGATRAVILWQFLIEAATLTAIGAVLGLLFGWLVAYGIRSATPLQATVQPAAIAAAF
ncbi:MAG: ABC transporter permease, partial [Gemmatimonadaceae bacterium]|nr:ABC transporter permease [Gemmatimonadaceae bacterium]